MRTVKGKNTIPGLPRGLGPAADEGEDGDKVVRCEIKNPG